MGKVAAVRQQSVEIEALGSLFQGPWEKRYWSSSRGKKRYPFPVGYRALARKGGETYAMEIRADKLGPLFAVRCGEIESTGPSANAAWEAMMKIQHPGTRSLGGNGEKMFGFADPVVQYLLRELVSASSKKDETEVNVQSSPSSRSPDVFRSSVIREGNRKRVLSPRPGDKGVRSSQRLKTDKNSQERHGAEDSCPENVYVSDSEPELEPKIVPDTLEELHMREEPELESKIVPDTLEVLHVTEEHNSPNLELTIGTSQQSLLGSNSEENQNNSDLFASMISLLLPNAVPLMKKRSRRRQRQDLSKRDVAESPIDFGMGNTALETSVAKDPIKQGDTTAMTTNIFDNQQKAPTGLRLRVDKQLTTAVERQAGEESIVEEPSNQVDNAETSQQTKNIDEYTQCVGGNLIESSSPIFIVNKLALEQVTTQLFEAVQKDSTITAANALDDHCADSENKRYIISDTLERLPAEPSADEKFQDGHVKSLDAACVTDSRIRNTSAEQAPNNALYPKSIPFTGAGSMDVTANKLTSPNELEQVTAQPSQLLVKQLETVEKNSTIAAGNALDDLDTKRYTSSDILERLPAEPLAEETCQILGDVELLDLENPAYVADSRRENTSTEQEKHASNNASGHKSGSINEQEVSTTDTWTKVPEADEKDPVANDLDMQSRVFTGFSSISKRLTSSDMLKPVAAFEHDLSVLCVALNARSQEVDICVSCGPLGKHGVQLYVYRISLDNNLLSEATLLQSFSLDSYENFGTDSLKQQAEFGIQLTPDGDSLLLLGAFAVHRPELPSQSNIVRVVSLAERDPKAELFATAAMRCLLMTGPLSLVAAGDDGCIKEWRMDPSWRHSLYETDLPPARYKDKTFRSILKLVIVPQAPHLVLGCDADGYFAIWNISKKQLLSSCHISRYTFSDIHVVDLSLVDDFRDRDYDCCACLLTNVKDDAKHQNHWRMALLENDALFVGNDIANRICSAAVMGPYGVAGTDEGRVFLWEFSTGKRVVEMFEQGMKFLIFKSSLMQACNVESKIVQVKTTTSSRLLATVGEDGRVVLYV
ncbi:uncharacterized protein LOC9649453 isoform X1 [Selaginella moellendorffii]|uniref:uncharacterized protein LOC9649453 isoform X1 n=1 Tax=Selaginella moellendorffii TaxID=88036 RepID=UPI000D1C987D|nr:uncharacterized protein LOC9649453 isoform X1 [Selaginella moellendorffii]|eukprot:XP_024514805.1 uncharacterized protein LOC9649453 isoform X1 [Selaginella moellendorffii]